ncbi:Inner membrane ABC transporter permease protein YcjP [Candidatus Entotheonellaceae bacterium PAL068K]
MTASVQKSKRTVKRISNGILILLVLWTAMPFYWMIATSLKPEKEIYGVGNTLYPNNPTLRSYTHLFTRTPYPIYLRNSLIISSTVTLCALVFGSLGAYAIARLRFPGRATIARGLVFTYLVPTSLLFIPLFYLFNQLGLIDTHLGLILAYLSFGVPFCTWLLLGYFKSVPLELEEAALVDGCSRLGALIRVIIPVSLPALAVVTFFSFTLSWNEFLYAVVFTNTNTARPLTAGLSNFIIEDVFFWGPIMAATFLSALPPIFIYLGFQRWVVRGLTLGAIKG